MKKYEVVISLINKNNKKILHGLLRYNQSNEIINYEFSPDSVLCDLSVFNYTDKTNIEENNKYIDEIVYTGYDSERAFNNINISKHKDTYYYSLAQLIQKQILNMETFSIKDIEKLRIYFDIKLNYSISYKEKTKMFRNKEIEDFVPLQYGFCSIDKFIDSKNKRKENKYIYQCNNLTEVLFSILHYLIYNGYYYIRKCNHCNKLYFYNHRKVKYCSRKSPYEKYTHLDCEQAVRNIKQKFTRRFNIITEYLDFYYYDDKRKFINDYKKIKKISDVKASVNNLKEIELFLKEYKKYKKNKVLSVSETLKQLKKN